MLNFPGKFWENRSRAMLLLGLAPALFGCISSTSPILGDAKPVLGERGVIHTFTLSDGSPAWPHSNGAAAAIW